MRRFFAMPPALACLTCASPPREATSAPPATPTAAAAEAAPEVPPEAAAILTKMGIDPRRFSMGAGVKLLYDLGRPLLRAREPVESLAFLPDGALSSLDGAGWLQRWDTRSGEMLGAPLKGAPSAFRLALSQDGERAATIGMSTLGQGQLWRRRGDSWEQAGGLFFGSLSTAVAFSPDGKRLALTGVGARRPDRLRQRQGRALLQPRRRQLRGAGLLAGRRPPRRRAATRSRSSIPAEARSRARSPATPGPSRRSPSPRAARSPRPRETRPCACGIRRPARRCSPSLGTKSSSCVPASGCSSPSTSRASSRVSGAAPTPRGE